jgi:hypothetical protein
MRRILSFPLSPMKKSLLLALACVLMPATMHGDTTNLLTNPGAESGSISGWTVTFGAPGVDTFDPDINPHISPRSARMEQSFSPDGGKTSEVN